jgi:hypothetical protein
MKIIGAGMAGLIAGHMLRRHKPTILEAGPALPRNHSALLRFRSDAVARATSIPFREVFVRKGVVTSESPFPYTNAGIRDINAYSEKVSGIVAERSIGNLDSCKRWVAPERFLDDLSDTCPASIVFGQQVDELAISSKPKDEVWVSTIPMPVMMKLTGWEQGETQFVHREITTLVAKISKPLTTVHQTVYLPHRDWGNFYRVSIHGSELIMEAVGSYIHPPERFAGWDHEAICRIALSELFGVPSPLVVQVEKRVQKFGKMVPVADDEQRKSFIRFLTDKYNIYSLGRFATWRPLLLDDVIKDIEVIEALITKSSYDRFKH